MVANFISSFHQWVSICIKIVYLPVLEQIFIKNSLKLLLQSRKFYDFLVYTEKNFHFEEKLNPFFWGMYYGIERNY
jgi:hypothetical protein